MKRVIILVIYICLLICNACFSEEPVSIMLLSEHSIHNMLVRSRICPIELMDQIDDTEAINQLAKAAGISKDKVQDNRPDNRLYGITAIERKEEIVTNRALFVSVTTTIDFKKDALTYNEALAFRRRVHNYVVLRYAGLEHDEALRRAIDDPDAWHTFLREF